MYYPAENYTSGQKENDPIGHHHRWFNSGFIWEIIPVAGRVLKFWFGKCSFPRYALILLWGIYRISHVPHGSACISSYKQLYTRLSNILIRLVRASSTFRCGQSFTNIFVIMRPDGWPNNNPTINTKNMKKKAWQSFQIIPSVPSPYGSMPPSYSAMFCVCKSPENSTRVNLGFSCFFSIVATAHMRTMVLVYFTYKTGWFLG